MRKLLAVIILIVLASIIIARGAMAVALGQKWVLIAYFGSGLAVALFLFFGQILIEGYLDSNMLWIFPCSVIFGGIMLIMLYFLFMYDIFTSPRRSCYRRLPI